MLWKRLKMEDFQFPTIKNYNKDFIKLKENLPKDVVLTNIRDQNNHGLDYDYIVDYRSMGDKFISHVEKFYNSGIYLNIPKGIKLKEPIMLSFEMDSNDSAVVDKNIIIVHANSEVTIVFDYSTDESFKNFHNGITKIIADDNSIVNIIKIQRMNTDSLNFDTNIAIVKNNARVNWTSIELGGNISGANYSTYLEDEMSESNLHSIYLGDGFQKLDLSYSMIHKGRRSISKIETRGVLMDNAQKVFRGNLDFKKGAKHSIGIEEEYVILLDPTVKADSIPALLCHEDDVQGEHAASAGQIDKNKLFYLMSRGLSERESKTLIIESNFRPIVDKIPSIELKELINSEISRRLKNE